ncbi:3634_t:CDS:2 [Cetraspora pellucida]|uniref:3634_t:CDS:1 n=1 Tax=Cetraspora pellucida TaxID=1433469 RepID=A0A9N9NE80_9GLOM|nr:3634_t:CDS:2 [Cetraspora pellucida]
MQLCYSHYLSVIESNRYNKNKSSVNSTYIIESSNLKDTDTLPTNSIPDIIILRLLSFAEIKNKFVNNFLLEIDLYLVASSMSYEAIDTLHKAGLSFCY